MCAQGRQVDPGGGGDDQQMSGLNPHSGRSLRVEASSWSCALGGLTLCGTGPACQLCSFGLLTHLDLRSGLESVLNPPPC